MPNWCENKMTVWGDKAQVHDFVTRASCDKGNENTDRVSLSFNNFVPMPEELRDTTSPREDRNERLIALYGHDNWYDWQVENWGCKWEATPTGFTQHTPRLVVYRFDTPWGPPLPFLRRVSEMFPELRFHLKYEEPNMSFFGMASALGGKVTVEDLEMSEATHPEYARNGWAIEVRDGSVAS